MSRVFEVGIDVDDELKEKTRDKKKKKNGRNWILRGKCKCGFTLKICSLRKKIISRTFFLHDGRKRGKRDGKGNLIRGKEKGNCGQS